MAAPADDGELKTRIGELAARPWRNPTTGEWIRFSFKTIERWWYTVRGVDERLRALPDVLVGTVGHLQSRTMDFYRELGDLFAVPLAAHNRWAGFKALRSRWADHIGSSRCRPVLIIDEAQEALTIVLSELRILASKELESKQLLRGVFAGDARLPERLRSPTLVGAARRQRASSSRSLPPSMRCTRCACRVSRRWGSSSRGRRRSREGPRRPLPRAVARPRAAHRRARLQMPIQWRNPSATE